MVTFYINAPWSLQKGFGIKMVKSNVLAVVSITGIIFTVFTLAFFVAWYITDECRFSGFSTDETPPQCIR